MNSCNLRSDCQESTPILTQDIHCGYLSAPLPSQPVQPVSDLYCEDDFSVLASVNMEPFIGHTEYDELGNFGANISSVSSACTSWDLHNSSISFLSELASDSPRANSEVSIGCSSSERDSMDSIVNSENDLDTSIGSIPLLEQTPLISGALETPNLSQNSAISNVGGNSEISDAGSTTDILLEAGYTSSEIRNAISQSQSRLPGKDRPQTHVFSQGKTFTYEKLSIESNEIKKPKVKSKEDRVSSAKSNPTLPMIKSERNLAP